MGKVLNSQLSSCDGWVCGNTLKKGSLPVDRLDLDSLSLAIRELIESYFEDGWLPDMICDLGCGGGESVFEIRPTSFEFTHEGGEQALEIIVGENEKWNITQAD